MELSVQERPRVLAGEGETGAAEAALPLPVAARKWSPSSYLSYVLFALCAVLYLLPFMRPIWKATDEGSLVYGAVRIVHGQVFGRDFFEVMGPGTFYLLAGFFKLLGVTFLAERSWLFLTSLGTGLLMYFLSRRVCGRYQILPPILLASVYFGTVWPMVNHHVDSNFFALLSVAGIVLWRDKRRNILLIAAGILAGMTTCILQPKGGLLLVAMLLWLFILNRRRLAPLSAMGITLASYCSVIAAVLLYFWSRGALRDLVYMNFVWPSQNYSAVNDVPYALGLVQFWSPWAAPIHGIRWLLPLGVVFILPFLLVAALPVMVPLLSIRQGRDNLRPDILLYWLCGWALWLSEFHRRDIAHLTSGSSLLMILGVYFLTEYRGKIANLALQIAGISAAAVVTLNLFIVLCAKSEPTRVGPVAMFKPDPVLIFLNSHVAPGAEIFSYPYCPMYYFLSGTTNPTRYSLLIYNYNTPSQFQEVIRVLDQHRVRYVLWDTSFQAKAAESLFSPTLYKPAGGLLMEPYLESHYKVVKDVDGVRIMERKGDNNASYR